MANCCQFITIENVYKYTPLDASDHIDARQHIFSDIKKFKIDVFFGPICSNSFCEMLKSGNITGDWLKIYNNDDFNRGVANWVYYYYLIDYGQEKHPDSGSKDIQIKKENAESKAIKSFEDLKVNILKNGWLSDCFSQPKNDSCLDTSDASTSIQGYDIV
ncbi:MAG: hypothetical protein ACPGXZ_17650 [Saprospiraceae bacterium]